MKDQVQSLQANGIAAAFINSTLDPIEERSGARMRLFHLGHLGPEPDGDGDAPVPHEAIAAFQESAGLTPHGDLDDETREALRKAHGS